MPAEGEGEAEEADSTNVELFRQSLIQGWGGGEVGSTSTRSDWARSVAPPELRPGDVLLAAPRGFLGGGQSSAAQRAGLRGRIPEDWPRRDQLRLLPVVLLTRVGADGGAAEGVLLNLRTGQLMGDFINYFHSRPLHYGGPDEAGLTMVHSYPQVPGAELLSEEAGLYLGGDFEGAKAWVEEGQGSSLRFRFFMNRVRWPPGALAAEAAAGGAWLPVRCSGDLVLAEAESLEDRPLWVQIAELAGGEAEEAGRRHGLLG